MEKVTAKVAGLEQDEQFLIILEKIIEQGGQTNIREIFQAINNKIAENGYELSYQGEQSLRRLVNKTAVDAGFIKPYDKSNPGWRITNEGRDFVNNFEVQTEVVFNTDTQNEETVISNVVRGTGFELYCIDLLKRIYPLYTWYHQGKYKKNERGLDIIGKKLGEKKGEDDSIGVQVKLHKDNSTPTKEEWLKFLAGCFVRGIDKAVFITTGRLSSEQQREAGEGNILVINGLNEINRIAKEYGFSPFDDNNTP